jgi:elongation factor P
MAITINQITNGMALQIGSDIYVVTEFHHVKPGKGSAFVRVKLKNLKTDLVIDRTFKSADKLDDVLLEEKEFEFLYQTGDMYHFMDHTSYEETIVSKDLVGSGVLKFLKENQIVTAVCHRDTVMRIHLPTFIESEIVETEPGFKGDSSRAGNKPAKIESGAMMQVPLFINTGDWVKIDTRTGQYVERVQK